MTQHRTAAQTQKTAAVDAPERAHSEPQIRDEELYRMAAFRIHETANRIVKLAHGAHDPGLRSELSAVCERLLEEERALLALAGKT